MTKTEQILRSDYARHFLMMFFAISVLMWAITLPMWVLWSVVVLAPVAWEILWKVRRQTPIDILDVMLSIAGGAVAILI